MDETRRLDKLDDALLFLTASVGILFGLLQTFLRPSTLPQFIIPVAILAWVLPFYFGYVKGAIRDSLADRYRGWIFLVFGTGLYAIVIIQEEFARYLQPSPTDPVQEGITTVPFIVLAFLLLLQATKLRKFVLGSTFPENPVLSLSARYAMRTSFVIVVAGVFLAIVGFPSIWDLVVIIMSPLGAYFLWRSNYYAARTYRRYTLIESKGPLQKFGRARVLYRWLNNLGFAVFVGVGVGSALFDFHVELPILSRSELLTLDLYLLLVFFVLALATLILSRLTRIKKSFDFGELFPEDPPIEEDV